MDAGDGAFHHAPFRFELLVHDVVVGAERFHLFDPEVHVLRERELCLGPAQDLIIRVPIEHCVPGGSVHGERANFTGLVLGCIEAKFCK